MVAARHRGRRARTPWSRATAGVAGAPTRRDAQSSAVEPSKNPARPLAVIRWRCSNLSRRTGMRIREALTTAQSPWADSSVERLIGSIRQECLDHVLVLHEPHLHRILTRYFASCHRTRTHLSLETDGRGRHARGHRLAGPTALLDHTVDRPGESDRRVRRGPEAPVRACRARASGVRRGAQRPPARASRRSRAPAP